MMRFASDESSFCACFIVVVRGAGHQFFRFLIPSAVAHALFAAWCKHTFPGRDSSMDDPEGMVGVPGSLAYSLPSPSSPSICMPSILGLDGNDVVICVGLFVLTSYACFSALSLAAMAALSLARADSISALSFGRRIWKAWAKSRPYSETRATRSGVLSMCSRGESCSDSRSPY